MYCITVSALIVELNLKTLKKNLEYDRENFRSIAIIFTNLLCLRLIG